MNQNGVSLIEVLIALAILSITLIAATSIIQQSTHRSILLQQHISAEYCIENQLAQWMPATYPAAFAQGTCSQDHSLHWRIDTTNWPHDKHWLQLTINITDDHTHGIDQAHLLTQKLTTT